MNIYKSKICILSADSDRLPAGSQKTAHQTNIFISLDGSWVTFYVKSWSAFVLGVYVTDAMREEDFLTNLMIMRFANEIRNKSVNHIRGVGKN